MSTQMRPAGPTWDLGDYEPTAIQLQPAASRVVEQAAPREGDTFLDVGCGTGNAALLAATRGADVTGVDPAERLLDQARERAAGTGLEVRFVEGSAEALPIADASVDLAVSIFGVIFSADPPAAAAELARVTAEGGRIVLTAWVPEGAMHEMARLAQEAVLAALGLPNPPSFPWHEADALASLFAPLGYSVDVQEATLTFRGDSVDAYLREVLDVHPLAVAGRAVLEPSGEAESLRRRLVALFEEANEDPAAFAVTSRYVIATLRPR